MSQEAGGRSLYRPQAEYDKTHTRQIKLKLNLETDKDILDKLDSVPSKQRYIKALIRQDIEEDF